MRRPENTWTDEKIATLERLIKERKSSGEIGDIMGLSRSTVAGKASRLGLRLLSRPPSSGRPPSGGSSKTAHRKPPHLMLRPRLVSRAVEQERRRSLFEPDPVALSDAPEPSGDHYTLKDLPACACKWPICGAGKNMLFCGHLALHGTSWCEHHAARVWVKRRVDV